MKRIISYYINKWWSPIVFWVFSIGLFVISEIVDNSTFGTVTFILLVFSVIGLLLSTIYQLSQRNWLKSITTFILFCGTIIAFIFYSIALFWIEQETPDKWADNLKMPSNISIEIPSDVDFDGKRLDSSINKKVTKTNFQLYNSFQPGLYEYDFWIGKIESGTIFLKAFEITQEYPLSTKSLSERSLVKVYNPTDSIMKFRTTSSFTIYEGDWGKPYAARFEVWFNPDNNGKARKIFQKNYKIEGWMR